MCCFSPHVADGARRPDLKFTDEWEGLILVQHDFEVDGIKSQKSISILDVFPNSLLGESKAFKK